MPAATGSLGVLASVILTLVLITLVSEVLGSVGEFRRWPLVAGCLLVGAGSALAGRPPAKGETGSRPDLATVMSAGLAVVVFARWAIESGASLQSGIVGVDSLQDHLPFAATFAQSGWLTRLHFAWLDPVWTFYPFGSEIFHAIGIEAFGRDVLSPVLNLGWLALAMLGAWCCGRRWQAGPLTLAMSCVVLSLPVLTESQPGTADNDIVSLALLLSAVALLLTVAEAGGGYLLAGVAAGLAAGTTLSVLPAVAGLVAGVLAFDRRKVPHGRLLGGLGILVSGGYWYLINLIRIGNPIPGVKLGALHLPEPAFPAVARYGFSVGHYVADGWFWRDFVHPGLRTAFGVAWPFVLVLTVVGVVVPFFRRGDPFLRPIALAAGVAAVVYVFTPTSAYGPANDPFLFAANLRFLLPSLALFLVVGAVFLSGYTPRWIEGYSVAHRRPQTTWVGVAVILTCVTLFGSGSARQRWSDHPLFAVVGAAVALLLLGATMSVRLPLRALAGAAFLGTIVIGGVPVSHSYLADRYESNGRIYQWARNVSNARIGVSAFALQYPLFGLSLQNRVSYVGSRGAHGALVLAKSCGEWREQLARGGYDYVVIGDNDWSLAPLLELRWTQADPLAEPVVNVSHGTGPEGVVFRLSSGLATTAGCSSVG